jgi:ubiquinone/menaquinone biosynthesis C-methylase UbiE
MERFVVGFAEDMKDVPDNSVDIVVSTMVLCSVRSVEGALKEVHRVLAPVCCSIIRFRLFFRSI